jgi:hypothetical protein
MNKSPGEVQSSDDSKLVDDIANLLYESDAFTKHLEDKIEVYQVVISLSNY